jgi:hypothetical protein
MTTTNDRIAALEREIAALKKAAEPPPPPQTAEQRERETAEWRDRYRQAQDAAFRNFPHSPEMMRGYAKANGTALTGDVGALSAATIPRSALTREDLERGRGRRPLVPPGGGTGIAREIPDGPQPGIRWVDAQMEAQDARDRAAKIAEEARTKAVLGK